MLVAFPIRQALAGSTEYITTEEPVAESVEDAPQPMTETYKKEVKEPSLFPGMQERLRDKTPFIRDTKLKANARTYYMDINRERSRDSEAWALGGTVIDYQSGLWKDRLQLNGVLYTTQPVYAPEDKDGTLLLGPGQEGFSVLGEAYVSIKATEHTLVTLGRQAFTAPYVNKNDTRMIPNTFEAYGFQRQHSEDFSFGLYHLTRMKTRNSDTFVPMSEAAGFADTD